MEAIRIKVREIIEREKTYEVKDLYRIYSKVNNGSDISFEAFCGWIDNFDISEYIDDFNSRCNDVDAQINDIKDFFKEFLYGYNVEEIIPKDIYRLFNCEYEWDSNYDYFMTPEVYDLIRDTEAEERFFTKFDNKVTINDKENLMDSLDSDRTVLKLGERHYLIFEQD